MAVKPRFIDPIERCLECNRLVYESVPDKPTPGKEAPAALPDLDLIVTICSHVFDRACLKNWLPYHPTCPLDGKGNVKITLEECLDLKNSMEFLRKHYEENQATASKILKGEADKTCSICLNAFPPAFYIPAEKGFMHKVCWFKKNPSQSGSPPPKFYPQQIAHFEREIKPTLPKEVTLPTFSRTGLFVLSTIWIPISAWAWGMNWRYYQRKNVFLFMLSLPTLLIINTCFLLYRSLRRVFTEKTV